MTDVLMYDGINSLAAGIARQFPDAAKIAGYANGTYAWSAAEWNLFPHADHVHIAVRAAFNAGDVLDVETGDASPVSTSRTSPPLKLARTEMVTWSACGNKLHSAWLHA